nr:sigma-70 family RNA polymerase sigma factor [uncultured Blautia sp.]
MIQLVKRSISGDADAFLELMEKNSLAMYKVARGILDNDEDAADAMQDTILTCFEKIHTLKNPKYFKTWMIRILINECNKIHRHYKNFSRAEELPEVPGQDMSIAEFEFKEMLGMLDESYRIILVLYYVEGFRIADIASILNMNENTVKTRLVRARVQLKQEYTSAEDNIQKKSLQQRKKKNREFTGITDELTENQNGNLRTQPVTAGSITVSARKG